MGGFGGALKQLSIGVASSHGKAYIHGAGDAKVGFGADHDSFLASMADAASSVAKRFAGKAVYINVMKNLSVDCDCCAVAENPCMADIGIMASLDPIAIDQACVDMVAASDVYKRQGVRRDGRPGAETHAGAHREPPRHLHHRMRGGTWLRFARI